MDGLDFIEKARVAERRWLEAIKAEACPSCTPSRPDRLSCKYRGTAECRIKPELDKLATEAGRLARLKRGRIPPLFWLMLAHGELKETQAVGFVKKLLQQAQEPTGGRLMVLSGTTGCGKSVAAAWAAMVMGGAWLSAHELAAPIDDARWSDLLRAALTVVDDVGQEHSPKGYAATQLSRAACGRLDRNLPTLMTTNLKPDQWWSPEDPRYDDRLKSRLRGDALGWHTVSDGDMRRRI